MGFSLFAPVPRQGTCVFIGFLLLATLSTAQTQLAPYEQCHHTFQGIINGTISVGSINNLTIWNSGLIYTGPFRGLDPSYPRHSIITPTFLGCNTICGPGVQFNLPTTALGLVTTWVFPLAILLSLPYESLHKKRFRGTAVATLNWLGTPPTSLTATIYNFQLIRDCRRRSKECNNDPRWTDLLYVLSVFNQFDVPSSGTEQVRIIRALVYGLYRPVSTDEEPTNSDEVALTRELLSELAYQLRMLRRRAVIPTMASLFIFLVAFVFSVVLSFADVGDNATVAPLVLGLLFGWLPILVIFAVVDRNPVSSLRTSELMSRWLHNVDAIQTHFHSSDNAILPSSDENSRLQDIRWWGTNLPREGETDELGKAFTFRVGEFIGQGRRMQYCSLVPAVLEKAEQYNFGRRMDSYDNCAAAVIKRLNGPRPLRWYITSAVSLFLVWSQVSMAFMIAYNTPTVGIGCWSGGYLLYGFLSSISWFVQLFSKKPGRWIRLLCHLVNTVALCWLIVFTILVLTGGLNTCTCMTNFGKYMNFENATFYLQAFNVQKYWIGATVIGGLVPFFAFLVAMFGWLECQHLWTANEGGPARFEMRSGRVDWGWLRYT